MDKLSLEQFNLRELILRTKALVLIRQQNAFLMRTQQELQRHLAEEHGTLLNLEEENKHSSRISLVIGGSFEESQDHEDIAGSGDEGSDNIYDDDAHPVEANSGVLSERLVDVPEKQMNMEEVLEYKVFNVIASINKEVAFQKSLKKNIGQLMQLESYGNITKDSKRKSISIGGELNRTSEV